MADNQNPPPLPSRMDSTSPFYLGPHDRPGDFITPTRLKGDNYDEWASDIQTALEARRKFGFLNGTITSPVSHCTQEDWSTIHAMLISWLMNTIDPEVKSTLSKYKDAKRLWDTLKSRFAMVNGPRIQQIKSAISRCEQTKMMSVATYFGKLTALWEELNTYEPLITCSCCMNCTAGQEHEKRRDNNRLHQFLMGLHSDYHAQTRANILSQDPLPSLDRAYQLVVQDERVRLAKGLSIDKPPDAVGFAVRTSTTTATQEASNDQKDRSDKSFLFCTHCKKRGHVISGCFELIGYPDWWPGSSKVQGGGAGRGKPQYHGRNKPPARANMAAAASRGSSNSSSTLAATSSPPSSIFSAEQWKALATFIGNTKIPDDRLNGKFNHTLWIIDTGASRHVTCIDSWLLDAHTVSCPVGLPNGKSLTATKQGSIKLAPKLILHNVLFVPELNCNLISVSQLIDDMQCTVQFTSSSCTIQDPLRELIGTSVRRDGLFYYDAAKSVQPVSVNAVSSSLELWHKRMGHPSERVVKLLPPASSFKGSLNKACKVCFRAKHPRDKFLLSENNASKFFEKIHCDFGDLIDMLLPVVQDIF